MDFYFSNRNSHPFWDFVADMDNRRPPPYGPRHHWEHEQAAHEGATTDRDTKEKGKAHQPTAEDEHMTDAEQSKAPNVEQQNSSSSSDDEPRWGRRGRHGRHGGPRRGHWGSEYGPFGFPFFGPGSAFDDFEGPQGPPPRPHGHHPHHHHHHGPPPPGGPFERFGRRGPPPPGPPGAPFEGREGEAPHPPPGFGPHGHHGPHPGFGPRGGHSGFGRRGGRCGRGRGREPFPVQKFLGELSTRLGIDLNAAAAKFGVDLSRAFPGSTSGFTAPYDLFDLPDEYLVHISLPGARREDIGLDFEGEQNTLRVAGVVHRPGVDEQTHAALAHDGRSSEVGEFESKVRLPANEQVTVEVDTISARLRDGILVVRVPKVQKKVDEKKTIRIETPSPSPERQSTSALPVREKEPINDNEKPTEMYEASPAPTSETEKGDVQDRDEYLMHDDPPESLPTYTPVNHTDPAHEEEEDEDEDEKEGEYVKINVD